ncbi:MAG: F0F1 ATP synthase subunit delta [Nitrospiraceae bacterium]|nr:F0F1 ATP synthase subunit delta [Nitrospiraceae bacterium]
MHLSLSTFLIEIANFFVLLWILWRLLVGPVRRVIAERKAEVARMREETAKDRSEAESLRRQYENRLKEWASEKEQARQALRKSLEEEEARLRIALEGEIEKEREKARARHDREEAERRLAVERRAMEQATGFAARFLSSVVTPEIEGRIIDLVLEDLGDPGGRSSRILGESDREKRTVRISSAYPLAEARRSALEKALSERLGPGRDYVYSVDGSLLAGLRIEVEGAEVSANLQDELRFFRDSGRP